MSRSNMSPQQRTGIATWVMLGSGMFAIVLSLNSGLVSNAVLAQRPLPRPIVDQRRDLDVGPGLRDYGDLSVSFRNLARQALPSLVAIDVLNRPQRRCEGSHYRHLSGTGFIIDPAGYILTQGQLVDGADRVRVRMSDGSEIFATSVRFDPRSNIAVLEIPAIALPALPIADSDLMQAGDWVAAVGQSPRLTPTVAQGIINAVVTGPGISRGEDFFQMGIAPNLGSPGSPILNLNGQVVGIQSNGVSGDDPFDPAGLAVPSNLLNWASRQLITDGFVTRGYLGITAQPITARLSRQFNVPLGEGALVNRVVPDSPAAVAKLVPGDIITTIDGRPVLDARHLTSLSERLLPGKTYPIGILRNGVRSTVQIVPAKMPDLLNQTRTLRRLNAAPDVTRNPDSFNDLGLSVREVTPAETTLTEATAVPRGVVIDTVAPGSPAAIAGLQEGMIIQKVGADNVNNVNEFKATEASISENHGALLYVQTRKGPKFVTVGPDDF